MTRTDLKEVVAALRKLADALEGVPAAEVKPVEEVEMVEEAKPVEEVEMVEEAKPVDLKFEDVRAVLSDISRQGKTKEMKSLLTRFGATKLSDVDPANYQVLLREAEVIRNA